MGTTRRRVLFHLTQKILTEMSKLLIFLSMLLVMMMVTKGEAQGAEAAAESPVDYMESERVMADPGKDAFNGMEAAVNNAAESVKGLGGELEQAINQAEEKTF